MSSQWKPSWQRLVRNNNVNKTQKKLICNATLCTRHPISHSRFLSSVGSFWQISANKYWQKISQNLSIKEEGSPLTFFRRAMTLTTFIYTSKYYWSKYISTLYPPPPHLHFLSFSMKNMDQDISLIWQQVKMTKRFQIVSIWPLKPAI